MWPFTAQTTTEPSSFPPSPPSSPPSQPEPNPSITRANLSNCRLSTPFSLRLPILLTTSFTTGFTLGFLHGSPLAAYRYRALNAHRLPATSTGWYLYHKSKNYHSILGGVNSGVRLGGVLVGWTGLFCVCEEVVDQTRTRLSGQGDGDGNGGQKDFLNTVVASLTTAGAYSWKRGLDYYTTVRTARMALKYGLVYGVVQDGLMVARGGRVQYLDWIMERVRVRSDVEAAA